MFGRGAEDTGLLFAAVVAVVVPSVLRAVFVETGSTKVVGSGVDVAAAVLVSSSARVLVVGAGSAVVEVPRLDVMSKGVEVDVEGWFLNIAVVEKLTDACMPVLLATIVVSSVPSENVVGSFVVVES